MRREHSVSEADHEERGRGILLAGREQRVIFGSWQGHLAGTRDIWICCCPLLDGHQPFAMNNPLYVCKGEGEEADKFDGMASIVD